MTVTEPASTLSLSTRSASAHASSCAPRGVGLGFRAALASEILASQPGAIDFIEIHPENYLERGGAFVRRMHEAAERWPVTLHGLTLGLASSQPYDREHVARLKRFVRETGARWYSDHLCMSALGNAHLHELLPLDRNATSLRHAVDRIRELQDALEVPVALENISYYAEPPGSEMPDTEFIAEVLDRADARLLFDVNNLYVNSQNHGFDPLDALAQIPLHRVVQIHVAGHMIRPDGLRVDTHAEPVCDGVFSLLEAVLRQIPDAPVLLERDGNYGALAPLLDELTALRAVAVRAVEAA